MLVLPASFRAQESYNECNSALELCPNKVFTLTNIDANKTLCPGCEDDFTFCFGSTNTIWLKFTTNASGGNVQVDFANLIFESSAGQEMELNATMLSATLPCNSASYSVQGNCVSNATGPFTLFAGPLAGSTTYYIVVSGDNIGSGISVAAECTFDISISGSGIDRPISSVSISSSALSICKNEIYTATASVINCPDTGFYKWFVNGTQVATTVEPTFQSTALEDGDVVSVETSCYLLCSDTVTATEAPVNVYSFVINAGPDVQISNGETVQLNGSTSADTFSWSPFINLSNENILNPQVFPSTTTTYTLTATENGCTLSDQVIITVTEELIFPTTFSPNSDGLNDKWEISGISNYPNCFVRIYNRWGQEIFQSVGYSTAKAWDGTDSKNEVSEGVYFYIVELRDDEKREFKGSITLIR